MNRWIKVCAFVFFKKLSKNAQRILPTIHIQMSAILNFLIIPLSIYIDTMFEIYFDHIVFISNYHVFLG